MIVIIFKTLGDNTEPIPNGAYVRVKKCGAQTEIMYSSTHSAGGNTRKINKDKYVVIDKTTGEISDELTYQRTSNRIDNIAGVKDSLKKVRDLINTNCVNLSMCKWITLTYSYTMTSLSKLSCDFKNYNKRCRNRFGPYEYIAVTEPQGNGNWHIHCILIFNHAAPFMDATEIKYKIWEQGNVDVKNIDNIVNLAAYLTNYLQDCEEIEACENPDISNQSYNKQDMDQNDSCLNNDAQNNKDTAHTDASSRRKKFIKKGRLSKYPSGSNIYRTSRNIKKPIQYYDLYSNVINTDIGKMTYRKVLNISNGERYHNTLIYECYSSNINVE